MQTAYEPPLSIGTSAYTSDGEKIGDIVEVQSNYFVVEKGIIFTSDLYIPMSAIDSRDDEAVRLSLTKDEIDNGDWSDATVVNLGSSGPVGYAGQHTGQVADMTSSTARDIDLARREEFDVDDETTRP